MVFLRRSAPHVLRTATGWRLARDLCDAVSTVVARAQELRVPAKGRRASVQGRRHPSYIGGS